MSPTARVAGSSIRSLPSTPFRLADLAFFGQRPALLTAGGVVSYADLAARARDVADRLGRTRRLVLVAGANTVEAVVTHLGALGAGHPVLLAPGGDTLTIEELTAAYDPDVVAGPAGGWQPQERREGSAHQLHPDLALLLSTSGSTGSPKLVRLSQRNVQANAEAIAQYLAIRADDRAMASLPMHYCYGLSVLHSHLVRGAGVVLTELSVVDPGFWDLFRAFQATTLAGVPHTFDLLDRVGFADLELPSLRYVTQAGGRLAPDRVRALAALGRRRGWDLFVMYGQTEATARMAYLPPDLSLDHPGAIGVPIPGGSLRVEPRDDAAPGAGELVYTGPNVMLGYATGPADLALGRTVHELRTGDIGRRTPDGLFEVVGRLSRFVKVLGLRVDLQRVEDALARTGVTARCAGTDGELVVVAEGGEPTEPVRGRAATAAGLPVTAVRVRPVTALPRRPTGKPDDRAVAGLAAATVSGGDPAPRVVPEPRDQLSALRAMYAELLDRPDVTADDTFVGLGGDSLSYVEVSLRLEQHLGHLPDGWHLRTLRELAGMACGRSGGWRRGWRRVETGVVLRATAIVAIVAAHVELLALVGGAHVLLAVAGYNLARFHITAVPRRQRRRQVLGAAARVAVPSLAWIACAAVLFGDLGWTNLALLHTAVGPEAWSLQWRYWFVEALVWTLLALAVVVSVPLADRAERRWPFGFALALVGLGMLTRYGVTLDAGDDRIHTGTVIFWLFALGWAIAKASTVRQRLVVTAVVVTTVPGFFEDWQRDAVVVGGLLLLGWVDTLPCPTVLVRLVGVLASASLYVYLTHWQVYPHLEDDYPVAALLACLAVGVGYWYACGRATAWARGRLARLGKGDLSSWLLRLRLGRATV